MIKTLHNKEMLLIYTFFSLSRTEFNSKCETFETYVQDNFLYLKLSVLLNIRDAQPMACGQN